MAITRIQATSGTNASGGTANIPTSALASPTTSGNHIIVGVVYDARSGGCTNVTDTQGNKYYQAAASLRTTANVEIWYAPNITGSTSNVITSTLNFVDGVIFAEEWSGLAKLGALDKTTFATSTGASLSTGATGVIQYPNQLVFVVAEQDISGATTLSVGAGFSNFVTASSTFVTGASESLVTNTTGAQTGLMATNQAGNTWAIALATFSDTAVLSSFGNYPKQMRVGNGASRSTLS